MAPLPDPTETLGPRDAELMRAMAQKRAHSDGRAELGEVYVRMFNNPAVAVAVGGLGEQLRFRGVLPDRTRELIIQRFSVHQRLGYEWSHHQRPAELAGITGAEIGELALGRIPASLSAAERASIEACDAAMEGRSIPEDVQAAVEQAHGTAGVVEIVALCGLYAIMGMMTTSFDVEVEPGLPTPPF